MRILEFITTKPPTPEQNRIKNLKQQKDRATDALKDEKGRQKKQRAVHAIKQNNQILAKISQY